MLSEEARRELKAAAASTTLREDCDMLRALLWRQSRECSIERYLSFLTGFARLAPSSPPSQPFPLYTNVRL